MTTKPKLPVKKPRQTQLILKEELYTIRDFLRQTARPMSFLIYTVICVFDFVVFPVLWSLMQVYTGVEVVSAWEPLTNSGGGIFHLSFGAICGVSAWSRTKEKERGDD